jgi:hypothetical protein
MQGSWTVSVKSKSASWAQRFRIAGSTNGVDGVYTGSVATPSVFVTGSQWGVTVEHNPTGPVSWTISRNRIANAHVSGGLFIFDIESDDSGGPDEDFNDLVLTCSAPLAESEYFVYGTVSTYEGFCFFNPCYPRWYYIIDTFAQFERLVQFAPARRVIEKFYPERVRRLEKRPFPEPDPEPFVPMMIPTGLADEDGLLVKGRVVAPQQPAKRSAAKAVAAEKTSLAADVRGAAFFLNSSTAISSIQLDRSDLASLAHLKDRLRFPICQVHPVSETLLRFLEYDRTDAEKLGDPYTGTGNRSVLGLSATDEFGNYIFRFAQSFSDLADEVGDVAIGDDLATQLRPDLILQVMSSLPSGIAYESAPYFNIPNVKRIDLCIPQSEIRHPTCQGGRAIQAIGDLFIVPNPGTTLHADGTITNTSTSGPQVDHAAWTGTLDIFACFLDTSPKVAFYTLRYSLDGSDWHFVNQAYFHLKQQLDATWLNTKVGPDVRELRINNPGDPKVFVDSYLNIEEDNAWLFTHRDRKIQLNTGVYIPAGTAGELWVQIEGFDSGGEKVTGALDTVHLYVDNHYATGDIDYIKLGADDPGECALFELSSAGDPLTIRYRVTDPEGFMSLYNLVVYRGSNTFVATEDSATNAPVSFPYQAIAPFRFRGTLDQTIDPSGYVEIDLEPTSGAWLPEGVTFCAFSFELGVNDRLTDGKGVPAGRTLWRELIGISFTPPPVV